MQLSPQQPRRSFIREAEANETEMPITIPIFFESSCRQVLTTLMILVFDKACG
jgi:hypothetical protein